MRQKVHLVDLDDTLISDETATREAIRAVLTDLDDDPAVADAHIDLVLDQARRAWRAHPHRGHGGLAEVSSWEALWLTPPGTTLPAVVAPSLIGHDEDVWAEVLTALSLDPAAAQKTAVAYREHRRALLRPLPGVVGALDMMSQSHRLWLVTNGSSTHQRAKLDVTGLGLYFERVFISYEVASAKSQPGFAAAVAAALDTDARQVCLVIGDSVTHDVGLARHGGWPAVHLCRSNPCADPISDVSHTNSLAGAGAFCRCDQQ